MQITITCPRCQATMKANKTPAPDAVLQCLKCDHWFSLNDLNVTAAVRRTTPAPAAQGTSKLLLAGIAACLVGTTIAATLWYTSQAPKVEPAPEPELQIATTSKKAAPAEIVPPPAPTIDPELEQQRQRFTQLMINGGIAQQLKHWDEAAAAYTEARKLFPEDADVEQKLAEAQAGQQLVARAKEEEDRVREESNILVQKGRDALDRKQAGAALEFFRLALQKSPTNAEATQLLTQAQQVIQEEDDKKASLEKFDQHILTGKAALRGGQPFQAIAEFQAAAKILPKDPLPPELIKDAEQQLGKMKNQDLGKLELKQLLEKADGLVKAKKFEEARATYQQAAKLAPNDPAIQRGLAATEEALKVTTAQMRSMLATASQQIRTGQIQDAIATYREARRLYPGNDQVLRALQIAELIQANQVVYYQALNRGFMSLNLQRYTDAVLAFSEALRIVPNDVIAFDGLTRAQRGLEEQNLFKREYDRHVNSGLVLMKSARYAEAAKAFTDALNMIRPPLVPDPQVQRLGRYSLAMARGTAALNSRQWIPAMTFFQAALSEIPGDPFAAVGLQKARLAQTRSKA